MSKIDTTNLEDKISHTEALIMKAEQELFYLRPYLTQLQFELENVNKINSKEYIK